VTATDESTRVAIESVALAPPKNKMRTPDQSWLKEFCLLPAMAWYFVFFLGPLCFFMWFVFWSMDGYSPVPDLSFGNYREILSGMFVGSRYAFGIAQSLWVAIPAALIATGCTYMVVLAIVYGIPPRYQRLALLLTIAPFWSSYLLRLYAWQIIFAREGAINSFLSAIGLHDWHFSIMYTQIATRIGLIHYVTPILIIILYVTVSNIDRALIEVARNLGATRLQTFRKVILPLSKVGLTISGSFAVIICLGDFLSGSLLGGGGGASLIGRVPTFPDMIMSEYTSSSNLPRTTAMASILVFIMLIVLAVSFRFIGPAFKDSRR
jgi:spermidine/putrescine transport system permease protein